VLDFEEVVRMDREYIRSWSLVHDLVILVKTLPALYGRGVY
jgi:lipopolysaccharide/colanic/teichoic acid biosynthesis glycosyltransferase